jgi:xanthine dehydrogenase YagR molybdenum-binding subunit
MPDYHWPPMDKRRVIGKPLTRLDGVVKSTGAAKYNSDLNPNGLLFGALLTSPYAHARVKSIDTSAAEKLRGVTAVRVIAKPGTEVQWAGAEIAAIAATSEEVANDAARLIKVDYEVLPHLVHEHDLSKAGNRAKPAGEQVTGDPDQAFKDADVVSEGSYGIPVITHCCLESHGQTIAWSGDKIEYFPSTQAVGSIGGDLGKALEVPIANIHVHMDYMGGGFGSKFPPDVWGIEAARLSKDSGGKPVKLFLDRETELSIAGNRPSAFGKIKVGAKKDGTITAWQSDTWASGGIGGGNMNAQLFPYVFSKVPNRRINHTSVSLNTGGARAWRAPNHPQASYLTCSALEDLAAKLNMDPLDMFLKNIDYTARPDTYRFQFQKGAELIEWK